MYQIIGSPNTRAFRLMWMLEELGEPYEVVRADPHSDIMTESNPSGKAPALRDGDLLIRDSVASMVYLADKHDAMTYTPGTPERARLDSLMFLILDEVEQPLWTKAKHSFALPQKLRLEAMKAVAAKEYERGLHNLAARLGDGPYLTGETFTYADILLGHCVRWAEMAKMPMPEDQAVAALFSAVQNRPALAEAAAKREAILAKADA